MILFLILGNINEGSQFETFRLILTIMNLIRNLTSLFVGLLCKWKDYTLLVRLPIEWNPCDVRDPRKKRYDTVRYDIIK